METFLIILTIISCHLIGDYLLQTRFIAESKGNNWYHMFIHCFLYCLPFSLVFNFSWKIIILFLTHIIIDSLKAKYYKIDYFIDQILHYVIALGLFLIL